MYLYQICIPTQLILLGSSRAIYLSDLLISCIQNILPRKNLKLKPSISSLFKKKRSALKFKFKFIRLKLHSGSYCQIMQSFSKHYIEYALKNFNKRLQHYSDKNFLISECSKLIQASEKQILRRAMIRVLVKIFLNRECSNHGW